MLVTPVKLSAPFISVFLDWLPPFSSSFCTANGPVLCWHVVVADFSPSPQSTTILSSRVLLIANLPCMWVTIQTDIFGFMFLSASEFRMIQHCARGCYLSACRYVISLKWFWHVNQKFSAYQAHCGCANMSGLFFFPSFIGIDYFDKQIQA